MKEIVAEKLTNMCNLLQEILLHDEHLIRQLSQPQGIWSASYHNCRGSDLPAVTAEGDLIRQLSQLQEILQAARDDQKC